MSQVWTLQLDRPLREILLVLADHADDFGEHVFPSVALIEYKTDYSERNVRRLLSQLRSLGYIEVVHPATRYRPTEYRLRLDRVPKKPPFVRPAKLAALPDAGVQTDDARGAKSVASPAKAIAPEPSEEPSGRTKSAAAPPAAPPAPKERPRDVLFDAIVDVCFPGISQAELPSGTKAHVGKVAAELRKAEPAYTPEEVRRFPAWWEKTYGVKLTPGGIANNIAKMRSEERAAPAKAVTEIRDGVEYFHGRALPPRRRAEDPGMAPGALPRI